MNSFPDFQHFSRFERLSHIQPTPRGFTAHLEGDLPSETLRVEVLGDGLLRLKISRGGRFDESPTFAVCADLESVSAPFEIEEDADEIRVVTAQMTLLVGKNPFHLAARRSDGSVIFETFRDEKGDFWPYATLNGEWVVRRKCRVEDAFYGLGEKTGRFNRRGRNFALWNADVLNPNSAGEFKGDRTGIDFDPYYVSIPFFYHHPHDHLGRNEAPMGGFFIDNGYRGDFDFSPSEEFRFGFAGGQYTEYVFAAPQMRDILSAYSDLTGRMEAPPLWALGYHQCRWFKYTQEAVEALAARHREKGVPCDGLWLDIEYMDGYRVFTWNETTFPDPKAMLARLEEQGFRVITIIDPGVKVEPGYAVYDGAKARDTLCVTEGGDLYVGQVWPGRTAFPDFATPEARRWWGELNAAHVESGLAGIWNDMNEPATGDILCDTMRFDKGRAEHARFHNQYGLLMAMATVDGLRAAMPDKRTFVLSRAGSAGIQRYAANWMGDNCSRWEHLWVSLPMALGFGVSGQPFVGADIGGFVEHTGAELFLRWMQCGVLTPFCRNHSNMGNVDQYAWSFGGVIEKLCLEALRLRYRLMPYIYSAFMQAAQSGEPIQKPLVFEFQSDQTTREIDDEYLFGPSLLVAPICEKGVTARQVYLPRGTWHNWYSGEQFSGERFVIAPAPMEHIPLFVRGGAIIPMWPAGVLSTMDYQPSRIELHVFVPSEDGEFASFLQEDDGLTFGFQNGAMRRTDFVLTRAGTQLSIQATVSGEGFAEFARREFVVEFHGAIAASVRVNGETITAHDGRFSFSNSGEGFGLETEIRADLPQ